MSGRQNRRAGPNDGEPGLAGAEPRLADRAGAAAAQRVTEQELRAQLDERSHALVRACNRPLRTLGSYLAFKALRALSSDGVPLPARTKARFRQSAGKRDPKRYLPEIAPVIETRPEPVEPGLVLPGRASYRADRPLAVIVSHEASRSGAPILALNLARQFAERYNVVAVCLRGGDLLADFQEICTEVHLPRQRIDAADQYGPMVDAIGSKVQPLFAVVNGIDSRHILAAFRERGIPTVGLFHEFASNILPRTAFSEAFRNADQIVFSTELTLENALEQTSSVRTERFHVLPQGRCEPPVHAIPDAERQKERARIEALLRPNGAEADEFLVLGAGYVQMRKGVDLFIDVARRVLATPEGRSARFVWIGPHYDPERDAGYSVYLKDQITRAGLADRMTMVSETSEIDLAYALSRVLLLTSRLDPLPNVAIDAMCEGLPVICFEKTTGIADLLVEAGLGADCVAYYLDTEQAASKLRDLVRSPDRYRDVAGRTRHYAAVRFDAAAYARRIEDLALSTQAAADGLESDLAVIAASERFDPAFMLPDHLSPASASDAARYYLTENKRQPVPRRPEPGFNPLVFAEAIAAEVLPMRDAYAEFLRRGSPPGPWLRQVIRETDPALESRASPVLRAALHIHVDRSGAGSGIAERLEANASRPTLFVSATEEASLDGVVASLEARDLHVADARVVINRGRDLGPLLTVFGPALVHDYDLIGHVHTLDGWADFLHESMLGGALGGAMIDRLIAAFACNERLGMVFPSNPNLPGWSANQPDARNLAARLELGALPRHFDFPIGGMFWARAELVERFVALGLEWSDYPVDPAAHDGTILGAIERLLGVIPEWRGLNVAVTHVTGITPSGFVDEAGSG